MGLSANGNLPWIPRAQVWKFSLLLTVFIAFPPTQMMKFAWDNYKQYALGKNELRPLTKNGHIGNMFGEWGSACCSFTFLSFGGTCPGQLLSLQGREVSVTALIWLLGRCKALNPCAVRVPGLGASSLQAPLCAEPAPNVLGSSAQMKVSLLKHEASPELTMLLFV